MAARPVKGILFRENWLTPIRRNLYSERKTDATPPGPSHNHKPIFGKDDQFRLGTQNLGGVTSAVFILNVSASSSPTTLDIWLRSSRRPRNELG